LVWEPSLSFGTAPTGDTVYNVAVRGVKIDGVLHDFAYQVIVFDPASRAAIPARMPAGLLGEPPVRP
jgi:hypothetical protein